MAKKLDVASLLRRIPSKLHVGGDEYMFAKLSIPEHKNSWGETDNHRYVISIDINPANPKQLAKTLLHESLHAVWDERGVLPRASPLEEEDAVDQLSAGLIAMFVENLWFLPWLLAALQK